MTIVQNGVALTGCRCTKRERETRSRLQDEIRTLGKSGPLQVQYDLDTLHA